MTADATGQVHLNYGTSGQTLLSLKTTGAPLRSVAITPKADGIVTLDESGAVAQWQLDNPHPEITWRTLFGKVWYEGYPQPEYVWQSTGGTDDFEAEVQPHAADLRDAQGDLLRPPHRGAAGPPGGCLRERVHAPEPQGLRQAGRRDHGGPAQRRPGLPGRSVARPDGRADRARTLPHPPRASGHDRLGPARMAGGAHPYPRAGQGRERGVPADSRGRGRALARAGPGGPDRSRPARRQLPRVAPLGPRPDLRSAELPGRGHRDGLRGHPDHLHDRGGLARQRARPPARGLAGAGSHALADRAPDRPADRRAPASSRRS